jgi:hypothetical protein
MFNKNSNSACKGVKNDDFSSDFLKRQFSLHIKIQSLVFQKHKLKLVNPEVPLIIIHDI